MFRLARLGAAPGRVGLRRVQGLVAFALGSVAAAGAAGLGIACGSSSAGAGDDGGAGQDGSVLDGSGDDFDASSSADARTSFTVDSGVVDAGLPLNMVDAASTPEGGRAVTPGVITCGGGQTCNAFASVQCCLAEGGGTCLSTAVTCSAASAATTCNELADCVVGMLCCGSVVVFDGGGVGLAASCSATCTSPRPRLCRTNAECPDGNSCVKQACSDGYEHEFCGVYAPADDAGAPFTCAPN